jgi:hypothetical protein
MVKEIALIALKLEEDKKPKKKQPVKFTKSEKPKEK